MNITKKLTLNIVLLTILLAIFGIIYQKNPFEAPSTFLLLLSVTLFAGTIMTLPFSSTQYSSSAIILSITLFILSFIFQMIIPAPEPPTYTEAEMGSHPQAEWQFQLFHIKLGLRQSRIYTFTGTSAESEIALRLIINKWNTENPNSPIIDHYKSLTYIPPEYVKLKGYRPEWGERH